LFAKSSGAHFNPVVTLVALVNNRIRSSRALQFIAAQIAGACAGAILANLMFDFGAVNLSTKTRSGIGLLLGEVIATAGLIFVIEYLVSKEKTEIAPIIVPAWIGSAYFFTSSTSFANPAVTISRTLSDTFAGIAPSSVLGFFVAQVIGALVGLAAYRVYDSK
jgi:glycerol uptake facilitator-like aquaporin